MLQLLVIHGLLEVGHSLSVQADLLSIILDATHVQAEARALQAGLIHLQQSTGVTSSAGFDMGTTCGHMGLARRPGLASNHGRNCGQVTNYDLILKPPHHFHE